MPDDVEFQKRMRKIEDLVGEIEAASDPHLRARAVELVSLLMELHAAGLGRIVELVGQSGAIGADAVERLAREPLVSNLLLLHGLHPVKLETRVGQALEEVRPLLRSHGGNVELLSIDEGVVRLRLEGSCHGCPSSAQTLRNSIEEALYGHAPDLVALEVEGAVEAAGASGRSAAGRSTGLPPVGFVPLEQLV